MPNERRKIVDDYKRGLTLKELSIKYYFSVSAVRKILIKEEVYIYNRSIAEKLTPDKMIKHLKSMTIQQIANKYKTSRRTISRIKRKYIEEKLI